MDKINSRKPKTHQTRCKKHPKHRQSPGVCAICLGEKLSQLSSTSSSSSSSSSSKVKNMATCSSSSSLSSLSSEDSWSSVSSYSTPVHDRSTKNYRIHSTRKGYMSFLKVGGRNIVLTKSKSMEIYPTRGDRESVDEKKNKKGGFWTKLIMGSRSKKMDHDEGLMHSKTMRERAIAT